MANWREFQPIHCATGNVGSVPDFCVMLFSS